MQNRKYLFVTSVFIFILYRYLYLLFGAIASYFLLYSGFQPIIYLLFLIVCLVSAFLISARFYKRLVLEGSIINISMVLVVGGLALGAKLMSLGINRAIASISEKIEDGLIIQNIFNTFKYDEYVFALGSSGLLLILVISLYREVQN